MDFIEHMDIYVVRHGLTSWNKEKKYLGWTNQKLIESEMYKLDPLKNYLADIPIDVCYSSDLNRCTDTLSYISPIDKIIFDTRLRELNFGEWEGKTYDWLKDNKRYQQWLSNWEITTPPNGESGKDFQARIRSFLLELSENSKNNQNILVVTHGGVIRFIFSFLIKDFSFWDVPVMNNSCYVLHTAKNRKGELTCFSYSGVPTVGNVNM